MREHYRLAAERKPEHTGWSRIQQPGVREVITPPWRIPNTVLFRGGFSTAWRLTKGYNMRSGSWKRYFPPTAATPGSSWCGIPWRGLR